MTCIYCGEALASNDAATEHAGTCPVMNGEPPDSGGHKDLAALVRQHFGADLTHDKVMNFLWNATAFPFADFDYIEKQVKEAAEKAGGDWRAAIENALQLLQDTMAEIAAEEASAA
jgi:hypothetical protein